MSPLDLLWHLLNFLAPAVAVGLLAPALAKLVWRSRWRTVRWSLLALWCSGAAVLALVAGWIVFGRDGRMASYAVLVLAVSAALAWAGGRGSRGSRRSRCAAGPQLGQSSAASHG